MMARSYCYLILLREKQKSALEAILEFLFGYNPCEKFSMH